MKNADDRRISYELLGASALAPSPEIETFLEREWDAYHRTEGHDLSYDWNGRPLVIVARDGKGDVAGVASGRLSAGIGHLSELMVGADARGRGVGGALLARFEELAGRAGCHKLVLHTDLDSPAHRFYSKRGWLDEATHRRDRGKRDFVRLYKFLDEQ